jgi:hypothetical protein
MAAAPAAAPAPAKTTFGGLKDEDRIFQNIYGVHDTSIKVGDLGGAARAADRVGACAGAVPARLQLHTRSEAVLPLCGLSMQGAMSRGDWYRTKELVSKVGCGCQLLLQLRASGAVPRGGRDMQRCHACERAAPDGALS